MLAEIYAAREQNVLGISSRDLAEKIPGSIYCSTLDKVTDTLGGLGPARGPDPHRGRGGYFPGRGKAAGAGITLRAAPQRRENGACPVFVVLFYSKSPPPDGGGQEASR